MPTIPEPELLEETPDLDGAYPRASPEQVRALAALGERHEVRAGDVLYGDGDTSCDFFVILEGKVTVVDGSGTVVAVHGPGRFVGELGLLTGQPVFLMAIAREPGAVVRISAERLRELVASDQALGDLILRALLLRRSIHVGLGAGLRIVGSRYSPDTRRLCEFAARNRLPHRWIDVEDDPGAEQLLDMLWIGPDETPLVILGGSRVLHNPSNPGTGPRKLARVKDAQREHLQRYGREPTLPAIAATIGLPRQQVESLIAAERSPRALEEPVGGEHDAGITLGELLDDPRASQAFDRVPLELELEELPRALAVLNERERRIICARFGLDGRESTLRELGEQLGVSAERVRQIEEVSLGKLRATMV